MKITTTASRGIGPSRLRGGGGGGGCGVKVPKKGVINGAAPLPPSISPPRDDACGSSANGETASSSSSSFSAEATDSLISQLRDHVEQGRIFDARSVAAELTTVIGPASAEGGGADRLDQDVRRLIEEVHAQSDHVESLLRMLHSDDGWTLAKRRSGVTVHFRRDDDENDNNIHVVRASTTFENFNPRDFVRFCSLFVETEYMHHWFPGGVMSPATVLSWHSKYSKVIRLRINVALPMISSRDAIVLGSGYHLPDRNAFLISTRTILEDTCRFCDIPKPERGVVRMATDSIFYLQLTRRDAISFKMISRDDLKLRYVPTPLLNYLAQGHMPFEIMKTIHRTIRNFEGTLWEEKIKERGAYYAEIEDKVYVQLESWEEGAIDDIRPCKVSESAAIQSTQRSPMSTNEFTENARLNRVYEDDRMPNVMMPVIAVVCVFAMALHFVPIREFLRHLAPAPLDELLVGMETERLAIAIASCVLPLFASIISSISRGKRQHRADLITRYHQTVGVDNDATDDAGIGDNVERDEFPSFLDDVDSEEEGSVGLEMGHSNHILNVSDITPSPQCSPQRLTRPTTRSFPHPLSKLRKVRSTLGAGLRGMRRKKNAANPEIFLRVE